MEQTEKNSRADFVLVKEKLGKNLASSCDWKGIRIMEVFCSALTDANFHSELKTILPLLNKVFDNQWDGTV